MLKWLLSSISLIPELLNLMIRSFNSICFIAYIFSVLSLIFLKFYQKCKEDIVAGKENYEGGFEDIEKKMEQNNFDFPIIDIFFTTK